MKKIKFNIPSPNIIFIWLWVLTILLSFIFRNETFWINSKEKEYHIINLLNRDGINWLLSNVVTNFKNFPVLPMILVVALGIGVAEETKFLQTIIKLSIINIPKIFLTPLLLLCGIIGNLAGSAAFAIIPPLGGILFKMAKRNPMIGIITGFAGVAGGLSANLFIAPTDVLSSGITESASRILDKNYTVLPTANWYFFFVSTFLLVLAGTIAIEYIVAPIVSKYKLKKINELEKLDEVTKKEKKALFIALIVSIIYILIIILSKINILKSIITLITILFLLPSIVFGIKIGVIKNSKDIMNMMGKSIANLSSFIVLCFFASQFIGAFKESNLGLFIALKGTELLQSLNINIYIFVLLVILFSTIINLFIGSLSAKWIILAPIFVPLFMRLGFTPEFSQVVFRIADSITNPISPLEPFVPFIIVCLNKYSDDIGLSELIKFMLPISISFFIIWIIQLFIWIIFNLSLGPSAYIYM